MKRLNLYLVLIAVVLIGLAALASSARAAPQATYELVRSYTGPGGSGNAGIYDLSSSIGQPAAGEVSVGSYTLGNGFWGGGVTVPATSQHTVYLPLILK
jgi:hypothetical protein